jgi:putative addiction module killer protein
MEMSLFQMAKIARLEVGNFGDCKRIDSNIFELRCFFGSGYRIYFGKNQGRVVILLCAGNKTSQVKDIKQAKRYWREYNEQKNKKSE